MERWFKDTCYVWGKHSKNWQLLDTLVDNSVHSFNLWTLGQISLSQVFKWWFTS